MKILALAAVFVAALQAQVLRTVPYNLVRLDPALDALIDPRHDADEIAPGSDRPVDRARVNIEGLLHFGHQIERGPARQVHLVEHREHFNIQINSGIAVCYRLSFDSLRCIDH